MADKTQINRDGARHRITPFFFDGSSYTERKALVRALVRNWDQGKKQLFSGKLSEYFRLHDPEALRICEAAEQEAACTGGKDDLIFWKTMYALAPQNREFFWKGGVHTSLPAMGRDLLEHLRTNSPSMDAYIDSVFRQGILSRYVTMKEPENEKMLSAARSLEASYRGNSNSPREKRVTLYLAAYMLSGQRVLYIDGREFHTLDELTDYMKNLLGENCEHLDRFRAFCHKLMDHYDHLTPPLESWLIALGKRSALESWKESMKISG